MIERLLAGDAALARDDLEVADRLFGQVAEADPRNAIAVVGLARIAVRRGELGRARELAERALAIDPDEAAAGRLLAQLDLEPTVEQPRSPAPEPAPESALAPEPQTAPGTEAAPAPEPPPQAPHELEPAPARRGWRAWLARLLRRG